EKTSVSVDDLYDADDLAAALERHREETPSLEVREPIDLGVEARVATDVVDDGALAAARDPACHALRRRQALPDDDVFAQRLGGREHELVALGIVEHQRQGVGLGEALQATEHDAQDLR